MLSLIEFRKYRKVLLVFKPQRRHRKNNDLGLFFSNCEQSRQCYALQYQITLYLILSQVLFLLNISYCIHRLNSGIWNHINAVLTKQRNSPTLVEINTFHVTPETHQNSFQIPQLPYSWHFLRMNAFDLFFLIQVACYVAGNYSTKYFTDLAHAIVLFSNGNS